jgi:DNA-binding NtrC family response regulator
MNFRSDMISGQEGFHWLERILKADPQAIVILMTAYADTDKAVKAIKSGATDFISKPWGKEKLLATLISALKLKDSQLDSIKKIDEVYRTKQQDVREKAGGDREKMREEFTKLRAEQTAKIKPLLSAEQFKKYEELQAQRLQRRNNN